MFKKALLFLMLALLLIYSLGSIAESWWDLHLVIDNEQLDAAEALFLMVLVGTGLMLLGVLLAVSLFGVLAIAAASIVVALLVAGISVAWPALLLMMLVVWLVRDDKRNQQL